MVRIPLSLSRRAFFGLIGLPALTGPPGDPTGDPIFALARRRAVLAALLERTSEEDERDRLCPELDVLAAEMADLPTRSLAAACLKLWIVAEDYEARPRDGFDSRLLHQVLDWMAARPKA